MRLEEFMRILVGRKSLGVYAALILLTGLALYATHGSCFQTDTESGWGKAGWVGTVLGSIGLYAFMLYLAYTSNMIGFHKYAIGLILFVIVSLAIIVPNLILTHDPCFDGTSPQKDAWTITMIAIMAQVILIMIGVVISVHRNRHFKSLTDRYARSTVLNMINDKVGKSKTQYRNRVY